MEGCLLLLTFLALCTFLMVMLTQDQLTSMRKRLDLLEAERDKRQKGDTE